MTASRANASSRIAIVGASSLRGKELKSVLEDRPLRSAEIILLDTTVPAGTLAEAGGEPTFVKSMDAESFAGVRLVFFAGSPDEALANVMLARGANAAIIDLTGALENERDAIQWIPSLDSRLKPPNAPKSPPGAYISPSAAVIIACTLAVVLEQSGASKLAILFFPPVSEHELVGVEELESQTADLLSFRPISKRVFDSQIAFNLLTSYGETSKQALGQVRRDIATQVSRYLGGRSMVPALQLVQAPVFYGYAFAAYAEFPSDANPATIESSLAAAGIQIGAKGVEGPTNASVAGEDAIHLARIECDPNVRGALWLWGVADNLRLASINAVHIAEELLASQN
jgi:aspartate-semialdehyde dehydrogenase